MVRVAGLKAQVNTGAISESPDKMTPTEQLNAISERVAELNQMKLQCVNILNKEFNRKSIEYNEPTQLTQEEREWLADKFHSEIFPVLSPLAVDPTHPFPFIPNQGYAPVLDLRDGNNRESMLAIIILPSQVYPVRMCFEQDMYYWPMPKS
jgi:polyphosphate kinase